MKYQIEITEIYQRTIEVEALTKTEALETAKRLYNEQEIIFDESDFIVATYREKEE